ncbi:DUF4134 family protein [Sphingobacterium daejeonense]|uniref:DUF4134 family protein n=1 Tax=Sphingobacterium daejeonense TaxID=371142 RepID=UPI003D317C2F
MEKQSKKVLLKGVALLSVFGVFAQGNSSSGINEATQMITGYFDLATKPIYAIGAVVGLIGGVKAYNRFSSGDPDTSKIASWFGACISLIVATTILRTFFLFSRRPMSNYNINKSIGRTVEFKRLKAGYLFIFAGGLLGVIVLVIIMYMPGVNSYICLFIAGKEEHCASFGRNSH